MSVFLHHVGVVMRLLCTTRGGLLALLVFANTLPMASMEVFSPSPTTAFFGRLGIMSVALSLLFVPVARWALGSCVGRAERCSTTSVLPLDIRTRALAEATAVLVVTAALAALIWVPTSVLLAADTDDLTLLMSPLVVVGPALGAMAVPNLALASMDRDSPYTWRSWARWAVPAVLTSGGLVVAGAESTFAYCVVGLAAGGVVVAWAPSHGSQAFVRRRPRLTATSAFRAPERSASGVLKSDFMRGIGVGFARGAGLSLIPVALLFLARWSITPGLVLSGACIVLAGGAWLASARPLGLSMRTVGGRWGAFGGFSRAWLALPVSQQALGRAVYLHVLGCSVIAFSGFAVAYSLAVTWWPRSGGQSGLLLLAGGVASLVLCGVRGSTAMTSSTRWQTAWVTGGIATGTVCIAILVSEATGSSTLRGLLASEPLTAVLLVVGLASALLSAATPIPGLLRRPVAGAGA